MMRRALTAALVGAALVLTGCSGDGDGDATGTTAPEETAATTGEAGASATEAAPDEDEESSDGTAATADPGAEGEVEGGEVEGGEDGQAAADVAKDFLVAMVDADPEACDYLLSFTDIQRPMTAVESDHDMCVELLPEVLKAETEAQGLDPDAAAALETLVITGADVDGDTAVVDGDNYAEAFADAMGDSQITLRKIDGDWYVDLDNSFGTPTSG